MARALHSSQVACRSARALRALSLTITATLQAESAQRLTKLREAEAAAADREGVRDALRKQACLY